MYVCFSRGKNAFVPSLISVLLSVRVVRVLAQILVRYVIVCSCCMVLVLLFQATVSVVDRTKDVSSGDHATPKHTLALCGVLLLLVLIYVIL